MSRPNAISARPLRTHADGESCSSESQQNVNDPGRFAGLVGTYSHLVIQEVMSHPETGAPADRLRVAFEVAEQVVPRDPRVAPRRRAFVAAVVTSASSYLHRHAPRDPWVCIASEFPLGRGAADLAFQNRVTDQVVVDEIKTGVGRADETAYLDQARRYVAAGSQVWGASFVGVRLIYVASPNQSKLVTASGRSTRLIDTPFSDLRGTA